MKSILILFLLVFVTNCASIQQKQSIQKDYLNEVFQILEEHSIKKDSVNFQKIKKTAFKELKNTNSLQDCYPIVKSILKDLGDNHSSFMSKEQVNKWRSTSKTSNEKEIITFSGKTLNKNIGYINMKGISSGDSVSIQKYTDSLQRKIKSIDNKNLKGWILDLRQNKGGNCWPMLAGIGPLLENGICGYFIGSDGQKSSWFYRDGKSGINNTVVASTENKAYKLLNNSSPIAVLTGYKTSSSGEVVVVAFHNKNNTRSFGGKTAGLSTGNTSFKLSDGSIIFLTTSVYADRQENAFNQGISPDKKIEFSYKLIGQPNDPVITKAIQWIYTKQ